MDAIILAGGLGTRLKTVVNDVPKPMAIVNNKPFIYYVLNWLIQNGVTKIIMSIGYKWDVIHDYCGKLWRGVPVEYSIEEKPLGTGGGILKALDLIQHPTTLVVNGDSLYNIELVKFLKYHQNSSNDVSIALRKVKDGGRYGSVELAENGRITHFHEKTPKTNCFINGGVYAIEKSALYNMEVPGKFSFEEEFLPSNLSDLKIGGYSSNEFFIDIGVPEDFQKAQNAPYFLEF